MLIDKGSNSVWAHGKDPFAGPPVPSLSLHHFSSSRAAAPGEASTKLLSPTVKTIRSSHNLCGGFGDQLLWKEMDPDSVFV